MATNTSQPLHRMGLLVGLVVASAGAVSAQDATFFVNDDVLGGDGTGSSWTNAFSHLDDALDAANLAIALTPTTQIDIWVAEGTYHPTTDPRFVANDLGGPGNDRTKTFEVGPGVRLFGGFAGTEDPATDPFTGRQGSFEATILDGDLNPGFPDERTLTVLRVGGPSYPVFDAHIDGFKIRKGFADLPFGFPGSTGGGLRAENADFTVTNCTFANNQGRHGGAIALLDSEVRISHCTFVENHGNREGGAIHCKLPSGPTRIHSCLFHLNDCPAHFLDQGTLEAHQGGAIHVSWGSTHEFEVVNCLIGHSSAGLGAGIYVGVGTESTHIALNTLTKNWVHSLCFGPPGALSCPLDGRGSGVYYADASVGSHLISNSILWGNIDKQEDGVIYAEVGTPTVSFTNAEHLTLPAWPGRGNLAVDPRFLSADTDDYRLRPGSPCRDAGSNLLIPRDATDLNGNGNVTQRLPFELRRNRPRIFGVRGTRDYVVDMGCHECFATALPE